MSSDFVRMSPEIETIDPNIEELMAQIIDFWEKKGRESPTTEGTGRAVRGAHAKTLGVVKADVEILGDVPAPYAQGIYAKPGRHGALIRFSSASNHLGPDAHLGPVLGFAIKIFDVDGTKLVEDEPDSNTFDLVLKNNPTFIANTAKHYLFIQEIGNDSAKYLARGKAGFHASPPPPRPPPPPPWPRSGMAIMSPSFVSLRMRAAPSTRSTASSTSAVDRTCSVRRWSMNCRRVRSTSISRSSCARISTRCQSTT